MSHVNPTSALLRLRVTMLIKKDQKSRLTLQQRGENLALQAYYLGRNFPDTDFNPFAELVHDRKDEMISGFKTGQKESQLHLNRVIQSTKANTSMWQ